MTQTMDKEVDNIHLLIFAKNNIDMQDIVLEINKQRIIDKIDTETAYVGSKKISGEDEDAYDRIATKIGNADVLEAWIDEGVMAIVTMLRKNNIAEEPQKTEDGWVMKVSLTSNWNALMTETLRSVIEEFIATDVLVKWYTAVGDSENAKNKGYQGEIVGGRVLAIVNMRVRPQRPAAYEFKEVE